METREFEIGELDGGRVAAKRRIETKNRFVLKGKLILFNKLLSRVKL